MHQPKPKLGHLQPIYLCLSRLGYSIGELQVFRPDIFCQAKQPGDKNLAYIYRQDMEILMTESHMYLPDIKSSPSLTSQNNNRKMSSVRLNVLTNTTWKLKTPGGILVFRVLVQVCERQAAWNGQLHWQGRQHPGKYPTRRFIDTGILYPC